MVCHLDEPPPGASTALVREIRRLLAAGGRRRAFLPRVPADLTIPTPLALYSATLQAAADGRVLTAAQPSGWQYLVLERDQVVGLAEMSWEGRFSRLAYTPAVGRIDRALTRLVARAEQVPGDLVLRMLRVPALAILAVWLHGTSFDRLVTLPPTHGRLRPSQLYTGARFEAVLRDAGQAELKRGAPRRRLNPKP